MEDPGVLGPLALAADVIWGERQAMLTLVFLLATMGFLVAVYMLYELWAVDSPVGSGRHGHLPH